MLFVLEHAPLKPWQLDVLSIIRDEAYYFAPQAQTKIMNEGWASYWHSTIMTRQGLEPADVINYCRSSLRHDGQLARRGSTPTSWASSCSATSKTAGTRAASARSTTSATTWPPSATGTRSAGLGRAEDLRGPPDPQRPDVHRRISDARFLPRSTSCFRSATTPSTDAYEIESREFPKIKQRLLFNLTNIGRPLIAVRDGNYKNRGELFLEHQFNGVELQISYARDTLANLHRLWTPAGAHRNRA